MNYLSQPFRFYSPSVDSPLISGNLYGRHQLHFVSSNSLSFARQYYHNEFTNDEILEEPPTITTTSSSPPSLGALYLSNDEALNLRMKNCATDEPTKQSIFGDLVTAYINPFLEEMKQLHPSPDSPPQQAIIQDYLSKYALVHKDALREVMRALNVKKLILPFIESDLPVELITEFHHTEQQQPGQGADIVMGTLFGLDESSDDSSSSSSSDANTILKEQLHALEIFLARFDTEKEVLSLLVWSNFDARWVCLPASMGQPPPEPLPIPPYPLCANCHHSFGLYSCPNCNVVKYCSPHCATADWEPRHHGQCPTLCERLLSHSVLVINLQ